MLKFFLRIIFLMCVFSVSAVDCQKGLLNLKEVYNKSISCTIKSHPNSDQVIVDEEVFKKYNTDGTAIEWSDSYTKILTENGSRENKRLSFTYLLPYYTVQIKKLQVIKPDGKILDVDIDKNSRVMIDDSQMCANIYNPNHKILKVTIPELQVGDAIRCLVHFSQVKALIPNSWYTLETFEGTSPIVHAKYEVVCPQSLPIAKTALLANIPGTVTALKFEENDVTRLVWEINNVPRMFEEPNMPSLISVVQRLILSTIKSWEDISKWDWKVSLPHLNAITPEMRTTVDQLIKDKLTDMEKIYSIYYFVAQNIRYMGLTTETEAPGIEPHDVNVTFEKRYGVCRDKNALLVAMLRIAGYKAYPVAIMIGPKHDKEVPIPFFNHAIACVELKDSQTIFLDATNENSTDPFPAYLCNRSYLIAKPEGDTLKVTPIIPANMNLTTIETKGVLDGTGMLDAESMITFNGINDTIYRNEFLKMSNKEKRSFFEKILRQAIPSAELLYYTLLPENLLDLSTPLMLKLRFSSKEMVIPAKDISMLNLPWIGSYFGIVNYILGKTGLTERKYPLITEIACGYSEKIIIDLDKKIKIEQLPECKKIETDTVAYQKKLSFMENILAGEAQFLINAVEFSPTQYLRLRSSLKEIETDSKKKPICNIKKVPKVKKNILGFKGDDARIINKDIEIVLKNNNQWKELHKIKVNILNYNGKKDNAEFKVHYNPKWENIRLLKASVTTDGRMQDVSAPEINIMDEAWNAGAPRYPGGKIFVVNLPGVEIGSTLEVEYELITKDKPFYSDIFYFREEYPIDNLKITLTVPTDLPLKMVKKNADSITEKVSKHGGTTCYEWSITNQESLVKEVSTPYWWVFTPNIIISTGSWAAYFQLLNDIFISLSKDQQSTLKCVKDLTKSLTTDQEKLIAIRNFIAKRIKQAGPSFVRLPLTSLSTADATLKDGYGNNADIAVLYYTMLTSIGYYPEFVIVSDIPNIREVTIPVFESAQRDILSQILVRVKDEKMGYIYLNDTDEFSAYGSTTNEGKAGFVLPNTNAIVIKPIDALETSREIDVQISLSNGPVANIIISKRFWGNAFGEKNKFFSLLTEEEKNRYHQEVIAEVSQAAESVGGLKTDFTSYPGLESFSVKVPNFSVIEGNYLYFKTFNNFGNLFNLGTKERFYPYLLSTKNTLTILHSIQLPKETESVLIKPNSEKVTLPNCAGFVDISQSSDAMLLKDSTKIDIEPTIIHPENYADLIEVQNSLLSDKNSTYLLKVKEDYKVLIVGGHTDTGNERGAKSYSGKWENEFNDAIVNLFAEKKNQIPGVKYFIAPTTKNLSLQAKIQLAKEVNPDLYIEIHHDSGSQDDIDKAKAEGINSPLWKSMSGFCILYYDDGAGKESKFPKESKQIAEFLSEEMVKAGFLPDHYHAKRQGMELTEQNKGLYNRVRPKSLFVLRNAISPAIILECGYIINPFDEKELSKPETRLKIVEAINNAITKMRR